MTWDDLAHREEAEQALKASAFLVKQSSDEVAALEAELSELESSEEEAAATLEDPSWRAAAG